jgi:transposase
VIDLKPVSCVGCGQLLLGEELQRCKALVTEYRRHSLRCLTCGTINQADWPEDMPRGSFGPRAQAAVAYLTGRLAASHRDVAEVIEVLHG